MKVDNFTLEQFVCPAKYDLRINQHIVPIRRKPSLSFGGAIHTGLAEWYRTGSEAKALKAIHEHWPEVMPSDDFRTEAYALKVMHAYVAEYPSETWKVLQGPSGAIVEQIEDETDHEVFVGGLTRGHEERERHHGAIGKA